MNATRMLRLAFCGAVVLLGCFTRSQEQQPLQYHTSNQGHPLVRLFPPNSLELTSKPPEGLELPRFKSAHPFFAKWHSSVARNGFLWIALDRTRNDGVYDNLFIDSDGDGLLDDETAVSPHTVEESRAQFGPVEVARPGRGGTYHLNFTYTQDANGSHLYVRPGGWYEGDITVGGEGKHCVLIDQNANGVFNDASINLKDSDLIQIGQKGDRDICLVGNFIQVEEKLYVLKVARDGSWIELTAAEDVKVGIVKQPEQMTELVAGGENGMLTVELDKGPGKLPIGKYRVYGWEMERDDENGNLWTAQATSFGNPDVFEISERKETHLNLGEPIMSTLDVHRTDTRCTIRHSWRGKSGEWIRLTRNGFTPPPAQVHIWNADGSYDRTFTFAKG